MSTLWVFSNLGQTISSSTFQQHSTIFQTKAGMDAKFHYWALGLLPMWINDHILKKTKKEYLLIFQIYSSLCSRIPLNIKIISRGFKFDICITNIFTIHNWSAIQRWPKGSLPLKGYRIPTHPRVYLTTSMGRTRKASAEGLRIMNTKRPQNKSTIQVKLYHNLAHDQRW